MKAADEGYQLLAAGYMLPQLRRVAGHVEGARRGRNVEDVHQARVASRRLRAALRMFGECFPASKSRRWRKWVRRLTRGLGPARDKDVQIEFVRNYLAKLEDPEARPGVQRLLARLRRQRKAVQPTVVKTVRRLVSSQVLDSMRKVLRAVRRDLEGRQVEIRSPYALARAGEQIAGRLETLLACQDCLARPEDKLAHHEMRICAKRLRYTMEISARLYDKRIKPHIQAVKKVQTLLGEVHDCDVWTEQLAEFLDYERGRAGRHPNREDTSAPLAAGIEQLRADRHRRRGEAFAETVELWRQLKERELWADLSREIAPPEGKSPDAGVADEPALC